MRRPVALIARSFVVSITTVALLLAAVTAALAGATPNNVVLVQNIRSLASTSIGDYYVAARQIPWSNVCTINCSTSEVVTRSECEANIIGPIRTFLQNPAIAGNIDYIVLTKGIPLSADYGYSSGALSITSILTCVGEPSVTQYLENPYGPLQPYPPEVAFSHQLSFGGRHFYLVTRLDGYTTRDIYDMIDRSAAASPSGAIVLDQKYSAYPSGSEIMLNQRLSSANSILMSKSIPTVFDATSLFVSNQTNLMGYFSWGSNDASYSRSAYTSNTFAPGSIADTYVSSSGRTFSPTAAGASLIADLIPQGACGLGGNVSEPYTAYATYPNILFDRYTKGFNLAESFYAATPMLFWKSVVVGDPLMAPYATVPAVTLQFPVYPLTGTATINAIASDPDGITHVEFYFDGVLVGTDSSAPFTVQIDTTTYPVGQHQVSAMAVDSSTVATRGWTSVSATVANEVSALRLISDAFTSPDEQRVQTLPKVVTAGTEDMDGSEFYIEESNRSSGIRVQSDTFVQAGDVVVVKGWLVTNSGERSIEATEVLVQPSKATVPEPWGMCNNRSVGGRDFCENTKGVADGWGLRTMGLLIRTGGVVTYVGGADEDFFYIYDTTTGPDGSGHDGIRVRCRDMLKPPLGSAVVVTGISSCEKLGDQVIRVMKPRRQSDIMVHQMPGW